MNTDMLTDDKAQNATTRKRREGVAEVLATGLLRWRTRNKGFWRNVVAAGDGSGQDSGKGLQGQRCGA